MKHDWQQGDCQAKNDQKNQEPIRPTQVRVGSLFGSHVSYFNSLLVSSNRYPILQNTAILFGGNMR